MLNSPVPALHQERWNPASHMEASKQLAHSEQELEETGVNVELTGQSYRESLPGLPSRDCLSAHRAHDSCFFPTANEAEETALDVARCMRHSLCEELVRNGTLQSPPLGCELHAAGGALSSKPGIGPH